MLSCNSVVIIFFFKVIGKIIIDTCSIMTHNSTSSEGLSYGINKTGYGRRN